MIVSAIKQPLYSPEPVTQFQIESEIVRLSNLLETTTEQLARACEDAATAEVAWKLAQAQGLLLSEQKSAELRSAEALMRARKEFAAHRGAEAVRDGIQEKCRTLRSQVGALQTLSANVRAQT